MERCFDAAGFRDIENRRRTNLADVRQLEPDAVVGNSRETVHVLRIQCGFLNALILRRSSVGRFCRAEEIRSCLLFEFAA